MANHYEVPNWYVSESPRARPDRPGLSIVYAIIRPELLVAARLVTFDITLRTYALIFF